MVLYTYIFNNNQEMIIPLLILSSIFFVMLISAYTGLNVMDVIYLITTVIAAIIEYIIAWMVYIKEYIIIYIVYVKDLILYRLHIINKKILKKFVKLFDTSPMAERFFVDTFRYIVEVLDLYRLDRAALDPKVVRLIRFILEIIRLITIITINVMV